MAKLNRRQLVKAGVGTAALAAASPRITFAQEASPEASPGAVASPVGAVGPDGHYPSGNPGVPDAWTKMPEPFRAYDGVPGNGGTVRAMIMIYGAPPSPKEDNRFWQGLDERLGVDWDPVLVPHSSYGEKATALIASGDMPDLFYLNFNQTVSPLQSFVQQGAFLDLTPYVTGDAINEYPNLAVYPDFMWDATKTEGKIYGIPCPSQRRGQVAAFRKDWSDRFLGGMPTNGDELFSLLSDVTQNDPDGNGSNDTWGMARYSTTWDMGIIYPMHGVPNGWSVDENGGFIRDYETEEFRMAVEYMQRMFSEGLFHPDSAAMQFEQALTLFESGRVAVHADGGLIYGQGGFLETVRQYQPDAELNRLIPFGVDGGEGVTYNLPGIFGFTAIPSTITDEDRIHELLRIFDWLSCPFGSEEWLYKASGEEGVHFEYNENGFPVTNDLFQQEQGGLTGFIGGAPDVNINAEKPEIAPLLTDEGNAVIQLGIDNPAANLFSPAAIEQGPVSSQTIYDGLTDVITGRQAIDHWDSVVEEWRSRGGDQIRSEYEEAYAASN